MVALYITSVEAAGKTALCAGIGKTLLSQGKKVGFITPVQLSEDGDTNSSKDATFIKDALDLAESTDLLCPIRLSRKDLWQSLTDEVTNFTPRLKQAYAKIARDKDIVLMEGLSDLVVDKVATLACYTIAETLDAKVIIVLRYSPTLNPEQVTQIDKKLEQRLLGVVINFVPENRMETVRQNMATLFQQAGIKVLGLLPEERSLLGISVKELTEILNGEILTCPENTDELVENIMLGAMTPDSGLDYFSRMTNKAAIIRGERADMQLAALETSTRCLILTNNSKPQSSVISQAEDKAVPIISVKQDASGTIAGIEDALAKTSFHNPKKLRKIGDMLGHYFDFKALYSELGLET